MTGVGGVSRVAWRLGAWATIPAGPMTADPTPVVISVAGLAVARKTLPARRDEAAVLPAPKSGCSQALLITPPDSKGRPVSHECPTRRGGLAGIVRYCEKRSVKVAGDSRRSGSMGGVESTADLAQLSRRQRCQSVQNAAHKRLQMNHAVRRRSNDHDAQLKGTRILLVLKTPIHAQQDIETSLCTPKQLTIRCARPACGLYGADLVSRQLGGESTRQILVKQNAHGQEPNPEPNRARQAPVALRPTETDRGTGRASLPLPGSRTAPEPAPACRGKPACPPRFAGRCGRPKVHQPCDHHTPLMRP